MTHPCKSLRRPPRGPDTAQASRGISYRAVSGDRSIYATWANRVLSLGVRDCQWCNNCGEDRAGCRIRMEQGPSCLGSRRTGTNPVSSLGTAPVPRMYRSEAPRLRGVHLLAHQRMRNPEDEAADDSASEFSSEDQSTMNPALPGGGAPVQDDVCKRAAHTLTHNYLWIHSVNP